MNPEDSDPLLDFGGPRPRPLLDFVVQGGIAIALLTALITGIFQLGLFLGPFIPFEWEKQVSALALRDFPLTERGAEAEARRDVLQRLVDQLVPAEELPPGMTITVHYSREDVVNAFATLGGNIVIYEGLIRRLPSENALSSVIGHEIGHVKHRDSVRYMSGQRLVQLVVSLATGDSGLAAEIVSDIQLLTTLRFSRDTEEAADIEGLTVINAHYGHINGYKQSFDALESWLAQQGANVADPPEFLRDHPDTKRRIAKLKAYAEKNGWTDKGTLTPLRQANFRPASSFQTLDFQSVTPSIKIAPTKSAPAAAPNSGPNTKRIESEQPDN